MYDHEAPAAARAVSRAGLTAQTKLCVARCSWIPLPVLLAVMAVSGWAAPDVAWNPQPVVVGLIVIFLMTPSFLVAALAARTHLKSPSLTIVLLGAGALFLGLAGATAIGAVFWRDDNYIATMFRGLACLSGACHLASASTDLWPRAQQVRSKWPLAAGAYGGVLAATAVLVVLTETHRLPVVFIPGAGTTAAGHVANAMGGGLIALAAVIMIAHSDQQQSWKRWYAYGLGLLAISFIGLSLQTNLGDAMNWTSRIAIFLGSAYLIAAVLAAVQHESGWVLPLEVALRNSEKELRSANKRLALALRAARAGFFDWDMKGGVVYRSPELAALLGGSPGVSPWTRDSWLEWIAPEDRPRVEALERQCIEQRRKHIDVEFRARLPRVGVRWLGRLGALYYDEDGSPVRMIGVSMDVTERKRTERLAQAVNSINDVVHSSLDVDEIMERAVSRAAEAVGCETAAVCMREGAAWTVRYVYGFPEEIIGCQKGDEGAPHAVQAVETRKPIAINDARNYPRAKCLHEQEHEQSALLVVPLVTKDEVFGVLILGHRQPGLVFDGADVDFAGKLASSLSLALHNARLWCEARRELAQRKEMEDKLRQLNSDLEARVAERTAQLVQVQKLEALGQLTGGLAHDFNNLLAVILGNVELLRKRIGGDGKALRFAGNAIQAAERGAALTRRMLAFARRQDLQPGAVNVGELVAGLMTVLRSSLGSAIEIRTDFPDGLWLAQADANQLELALLNLSVNARDAIREKQGPGGTGTLVFAARNETVPSGVHQLAGGDYVTLSVIDSGAGMNADTLSRAADPFFTTKGPGKGTGLGLSMVQGLALQSGGALRLTSEAGEGATIQLWLPRAAAEPGSKDACDARPPFEDSSLAILLVDDDGLVCVATADMLIDLGHRVYEAQSAKQALEILRGGAKIDLVITDHVMPGMTGLQLAKEIQTRWPGVPVVLATGFAESSGDSDFGLVRLEKPYDQNSLVAAVAEALRPADAAGEDQPRPVQASG
jgi:signal transduction histidine kinase/CheY-like chemotaxis protein/PAS domain-containing protein